MNLCCFLFKCLCHRDEHPTEMARTDRGKNKWTDTEENKHAPEAAILFSFVRDKVRCQIALKPSLIGNCSIRDKFAAIMSVLAPNDLYLSRAADSPKLLVIIECIIGAPTEQATRDDRVSSIASTICANFRASPIPSNIFFNYTVMEFFRGNPKKSWAMM
ncbi:LADA_0C02828g1_1 [Lachancea dasiensis]|uniref:LADA_0C02828g1_1 n=1 Tax=Lachancea dasiensis TaxID=1072105 RepID=A0A1G4IYQ7_9SACH|nr:LADA_0C02828g1_1 [Lachancea dasiensis]